MSFAVAATIGRADRTRQGRAYWLRGSDAGTKYPVAARPRLPPLFTRTDVLVPLGFVLSTGRRVWWRFRL